MCLVQTMSIFSVMQANIIIRTLQMMRKWIWNDYINQGHTQQGLDSDFCLPTKLRFCPWMASPDCASRGKTINKMFLIRTIQQNSLSIYYAYTNPTAENEVFLQKESETKCLKQRRQHTMHKIDFNEHNFLTVIGFFTLFFFFWSFWHRVSL